MSLTTRSIQNIIGNISEAAGFGRIITANMLRNNYYLRVIDYDIELSNVELSLKHGSFTTRCQYYSDIIDNPNLER
jgi:site-specific recombinase XerD